MYCKVCKRQYHGEHICEPVEDCPHGCEVVIDCLRFDQGGSVPRGCALDENLLPVKRWERQEAPVKPEGFTPLLSAHQIKELEKVLLLAHTTPQSLGCDFHNQALAVMEFFGFAAE